MPTLGLDLTEHAGQDYIEVVLHTPADLAALTAAGLGFDVRIPDLLLREAENKQVNAAYAAATAQSPRAATPTASSTGDRPGADASGQPARSGAARR